MLYHSKILSLTCQNLNRSRHPEHTPFWVAYHAFASIHIKMPIKFELPSFNHSNDMKAAPKYNNRRDLG